MSDCCKPRERARMSDNPETVESQVKPDADDDDLMEDEIEQMRSVHVNDAAANAPSKFCGNTVTTAKYSLLTFIPLNLYEQFRRLANVYFLIVAGLQVCRFLMY